MYCWDSIARVERFEDGLHLRVRPIKGNQEPIKRHVMKVRKIPPTDPLVSQCLNAKKNKPKERNQNETTKQLGPNRKPDNPNARKPFPMQRKSIKKSQLQAKTAG